VGQRQRGAADDEQEQLEIALDPLTRIGRSRIKMSMLIRTYVIMINFPPVNSPIISQKEGRYE
jgi:hypothetical protein